MIQNFQLKFANSRPWLIVAVVVAAGLFLYFAAQGVRYWQATGEISAVKAEILRLERATGQLPAGRDENEAKLEAKTDQLGSLLQLFDYPAADTLMSIVADTVGSVGLGLISMTAEEAVIEDREGLRYQVRPISVVVEGPTSDFRNFLSVLYDLVPIVVASDARMVNLDTSPSTQVQLRFYLSPEPISEGGEETSG